MVADGFARTHATGRESASRPETLGGFFTELRRMALGLASTYASVAQRATESELVEQFRLHAQDFRIHGEDLERCLVALQGPMDANSLEDITSEVAAEPPTQLTGLALVDLLQAREDALATRYQWFLREGPWRVELHVSAVLQLGLSVVLIHRSWLLLQRARLEPGVAFSRAFGGLLPSRVDRVG